MDDEEYELDQKQKYVVVIIYDISDNSRRIKLAKYLNSFGVRVQKSAFEARLNKKQYKTLLDGLRQRLVADDNVRVYKLYGYQETEIFGSKNYAEEEDVIII